MTQEFRHRMHVVLVRVDFLGNLRVGQVQAHEVQAQDPDGPELAASRLGRRSAYRTPCTRSAADGATARCSRAGWSRNIVHR